MKYVGQLCYYDEEKQELHDLSNDTIYGKDGTERKIPKIEVEEFKN